MKKILLSILLTASPFVMNAQITLERCRDLAREHYPEVARYDLVAQSEEYDIANASRNWIPQITLSGQASWQNAVATFPKQFSDMITSLGTEMPGLAKDQYKIGLDVSQTIWDGGASKAEKELAKAEADEQRLNTDVDIHTLNERVDNLFFGMLLLEENYKTAISKKELLESNYSKLESLYRNGIAQKSDLDLVKVEKLQLEQAIDQNRASYASYRSMLEAMTGQNLQNQTLVRPDELPVLSDAARRPELGVIDARLSVLDARESALKVSLTPKFSAFAQGYYGNPGLDMFKSMMSHDWTWNAIVGVRMMVNVSSFFTYASDKKRIENNRQNLLLQKDIFNYNLNQQTIQQNGAIASMKRSIENDGEIVELRRSIRTAAESQLSNGVLDTAGLLRKISDETESINTKNIHEIELLKGQYELENTLR